VVEFQEKPERPKPLPDTADRALVSMGNYLFSRQALVEALVDDARRSTDHDFGRSIIPELVLGDRVFGYDFQTNDVPGVKPYEEPGYWRDVGRSRCTGRRTWTCSVSRRVSISTITTGPSAPAPIPARRPLPRLRRRHAHIAEARW